MRNYIDFILEQKEKEEDWKFSIDVSKMWNQYEKEQVTLEQFNTAYIKFLQENQSAIQDTTKSWDKLNEIIIKLEEKKSDVEGSFAIWDDIYDWADSNLVEIKAQNKKDF